jgi:hypothetical protein
VVCQGKQDGYHCTAAVSFLGKVLTGCWLSVLLPVHFQTAAVIFHMVVQLTSVWQQEHTTPPQYVEEDLNKKSCSGKMTRIA